MPVRATLSLLLALVACSGDSAPAPAEAPAASGYQLPAGTKVEDLGDVLAVVGDIPIGAKEFEMAAARVAPEDGVALSDDEKREILKKLVDEKMLYLEARKQGIDLDPKVQKVMINTLLRQEVYAQVRNSDFSEDELRAYFEAHKDEFVVPEKLQVKRIFVRISADRGEDAARALLTDLRAKILANPESFKDLAAEHSEDPYRRRGGDLGFLSSEGKPGIPPEVVTQAFQLDVGQCSEIFAADGGLNLVYVANKRERVERTFEQMKGSVLRKVKNDRYQELYDRYTGGLRSGYAVELHEDKLAGLTIESGRRGPAAPGIRSIRAPGGPGAVLTGGDEGDEPVENEDAE